MNAVVKTKQGLVEGLKSEDGKTAIFRGIPYAQPPVGELRFRRPQEHAPWEGVLPCQEFPYRCPQADPTKMGFYAKEFYDSFVPECGEDCLRLNLWVPADSTPESGLPVLFWIHGGAFLHGWGSEKEFDGEGFAKKGVILCTINYRVNVFGFFAHPELERETEEHVSGNYGILDQIFALKWIRENIAAFGGDPGKITIAGQSAGCMSVQSIISSPLSRGMLRGAILQSGGGLRAVFETPNKEQLWDISEKLMEHLQVKTIKDLREVPANTLMEAAYAVNGEGLGWTPHQDGWLLPTSTDALAEAGKIHDISYMIGSTGDDIGGDTLLQESGARFCENQLKLGRTPAYFYFFDRKLPGDNAGAFHSSELWYVFETYPRCWRPWEECDRELSRVMSAYWANFVKTGDPNGGSLPRWKPYTTENREPILLAEKLVQKGT